MGFTSNHKHALIGTQQPLIGLDSSSQMLSGQFPISDEVSKVPSLVPESAKLSKLSIHSCCLCLEEKPSSVKTPASQEFQRDGSQESAAADRVVTSTEFFLDQNSNNSTSLENTGLCDSPEDTPTFIKHSKVIHKSLPKMTRQMVIFRTLSAHRGRLREGIGPLEIEKK